MASPKGMSCSPNAPISCSPVNQLITPPELGTVLARLVNAFPAVAAFVTAAESIPFIEFEKDFIPFPKSLS